MLRHFPPMIKGLCLLPIGAALALAMTSGAALQAARYKNSLNHYSFAIPAGWKPAPAGMVGIPAGAPAYFGRPSNGFAPNMNVIVENVGNLDLSQYIAASKRGILAAKINAKLTDEKATSLGGAPARTWHMTLTLPGKPQVENRQVFCVHNAHGFVVTFSALPSNIAQYEPVFEKARASFKWE